MYYLKGPGHEIEFKYFDKIDTSRSNLNDIYHVLVHG